MVVTLNQSAQTKFGNGAHIIGTQDSHQKHDKETPREPNVRLVVRHVRHVDAFTPQTKINMTGMDSLEQAKRALARGRKIGKALDTHTPEQLVDQGFALARKQMSPDYFKSVMALLKGNPKPMQEGLNREQARQKALFKTVEAQYGEPSAKFLQDAVDPLFANVQPILELARELPKEGPKMMEQFQTAFNNNLKPAMEHLKREEERAKIQAEGYKQGRENLLKLQKMMPDIMKSVQNKLGWQQK